MVVTGESVMGLDMYLNGRRFFMKDKFNEEGDRVSEERIDLGYWRKHPNLHGYIVDQFADGEDDCRPIELSIENIQQIADAVANKKLEKTEGFFFGISDESDERINEDLKIMGQAIAWLSKKEEGEFRSVIYQASW